MTMKRLTLMLAGATILSGCALNPFGGGDPKDTPVLGERQAVLGTEIDIGIDAATAALPLALPAPQANANWEQSGGNAAKSIGHVALGNDPQLAWTANIGRGSSNTARLAHEPIVADGRVYTIDTRATVRAFDAASGAEVWATQFGADVGNQDSLYGGGVAYGNGRLFATNGLGYVVAMDPATGGIFWTVTPGGPLRGAPTYDGQALYVTSQDNQLFSLSPQNGATNWSEAATLEIAGLFGAASPAAARGTVVAGFSSGELNAYRYENGRQVWQDALARTSINTAVSTLSDIDADPVIDNDQVFAVGQGGRAVALDLLSGQRLWELNVAGSSTPLLSGQWLFVMTSAAQLIAVERSTGRVRWINQLPRYRRENSKRGPIFYSGPVLAGNRLYVTSSQGAMIEIEPDRGAFVRQRELGGPANLEPVVAGQTLYVLRDDGTLMAFR